MISLSRSKGTVRRAGMAWCRVALALIFVLSPAFADEKEDQVKALGTLFTAVANPTLSGTLPSPDQNQLVYDKVYFQDARSTLILFHLQGPQGVLTEGKFTLTLTPNEKGGALEVGVALSNTELGTQLFLAQFRLLQGQSAGASSVAAEFEPIKEELLGTLHEWGQKPPSLKGSLESLLVAVEIVDAFLQKAIFDAFVKAHPEISYQSVPPYPHSNGMLRTLLNSFEAGSERYEARFGSALPYTKLSHHIRGDGFRDFHYALVANTESPGAWEFLHSRFLAAKEFAGRFPNYTPDDLQAFVTALELKLGPDPTPLDSACHTLLKGHYDRFVSRLVASLSVLKTVSK